MKALLFLILLFLVFTPTISAQHGTSSNDNKTARYKSFDHSIPMPNPYIPFGRNKQIIPGSPRDRIFGNDPREQFIDLPLRRGWELNEFLHPYPDRHKYSHFPEYAAGQASELQQNRSSTDSVQTAWVRHYGTALIPSKDYVSAMIVDTQGNVYVSGDSYGSGTALDYTTVKYNSEGMEQWVTRYNGPGNSYDFADALAVDNQGNVYVTGMSKNNWGNFDYATVKYNSEGIEQWVARYNGPGDGDDWVFGLAIDTQGNVYVTGMSEYSDTYWDYITVKYNSSGIEQWVTRYNGPGNGYDGARGITIDVEDNVYVTGVSSGTASYKYYDYATIKYDSSGAEQWVTRYNNPEEPVDWLALELDDKGNVYVTGIGATIKYNPAGVQQWAADGGSALALDAQGNVYVTGYSEGSETESDYATIKYDSAGVEQWVVLYNGPGNDNDYANALAVDAQGNVYVTGYSVGSETEYDYATIKYDSAGAEQWVARYNGLENSGDYAGSLAVDAQGNIYVAGESYSLETGSDYATVKYNSAGVQQWSTCYNGQNYSQDGAVAMAVDAQNNVYVTGTSYGLGSGDDYATIKYNSEGIEQWVARYNGPGNGSDRAEALALDKNGNVYVTGVSENSETDFDYSTVKYNSSGIEQWVARYNIPEEDRWGLIALALDNDGNIYVTGSSATIKYNPTGVQQWVADGGSALAIDVHGNVYVTGTSDGPETTADYATVKYNSEGVEQWVAQYNGPGNGYDGAVALAVDDQSNVYVTGGSRGSESYGDYATVKYNSEGIEQWVARYNGPGNYIYDGARALAIDVEGNVYVTGTSSASVEDADCATVKYNSAGIEQWVARFNGQGNSDDWASALAVDAQGNVYVIVNSYNPDVPATVKYNPEGIEQWVAQYNDFGNSYGWAEALAVDAQGNVYVTGTSGDSYGMGRAWSVFATIKYSQTATRLEQEIVNAPVTYGLEQNYPNPFNPSTTIEFSLPNTDFVTLKIYNLLGQEVTTLVSERLKAGKYQYTWDASRFSSGVYLCRLYSNQGFIQTKKLILMK